MKRLLLVLMILLPFAASSKDKKISETEWQAWSAAKFDSLKNDGMNVTEDGLQFVKIISVPGLDKSKLYTKAMTAVSSLYNNGKLVVQNSDKAEGLIFGKASLYNEMPKMAWQVDAQFYYNHIIKIEIKDEKVRLTMLITDYDFKLINKLNGETISQTEKPVTVFKFYPFGNKESSYKVKRLSFEMLIGCFDRTKSFMNAFVSEMQKKTNVDW